MISYIYFGATAYYHVQEYKQDPRAKKTLYLGHTTSVKGYYLWSLNTRNIVFSRDVTFDETPMVKKQVENIHSRDDNKTNRVL